MINANQDLDLDSPRFIIYGRRTSSSEYSYTNKVELNCCPHTDGGIMSLSVHSETPLRTTSMVNPFPASGDAPPLGGNYPLILMLTIVILVATR